MGWIVSDNNAFGDRKHLFDEYEEASYFMKVSIESAARINKKDMPSYKIQMEYELDTETKEMP